MYQFKIYKEIELISIKLSGDVDFAEMVEVNLHLFASENFSRHYNGLSDLRDARININQQHIQQLRAAVAELGELTGRWAHLSHSPRSVVLVQEYSEAVGDTQSIQAFDNLKDAEKFLGYENLRPYLIRSLPR